MSIQLSNSVVPFSVECDKKPTILMDVDTYSRIQKIIELSPEEVSWFSYVENAGDNIFKIKDAYIIPQKVTGSETEMTTEGLSEFMTKTIKEKGMQYYKNIRCWGHSHVNMSVSPSGQDVKQISEFNNGEFYIMLIFNKKGDIYSEIRDFKNGLRYKGIPIMLDANVNQNVDDIKQELDEKVKKQTFSHPSFVPNYHYVNGRPIDISSKPEPAIKLTNENEIDGQVDIFDDISFPTYELVERIFNNACDIVKRVNNVARPYSYHQRYSFDEVIEIAASTTQFLTARQYVSMRVANVSEAEKIAQDIAWILRSNNSDLLEIIAYMETYDQDFDPDEYESAQDYYDVFVEMNCIEDDEEQESELGEDLISDSFEDVNKAILGGDK